MLEQIRNFLNNNPAENEEIFFDNENIIWIDWREYDEDIISYVNTRLPEQYKIRWECVKSDKERGEDIILKKTNNQLVIPYQDDKMDRDTTLITLDKFIETHKICWFKASLGDDTLGFIVLSNADWENLKEDFGEEKLKFYFSPASEENAIFELSMGEITKLLDSRKKENPFI